MTILKGKRIFIVEDDVSNRSIMQFLLEKAGAVIAFERWGRDTVQRLEAFQPVDIILLDLMLPNNVTGYDVFDQIRAKAEFANVPIVAVSAAEAEEAIPKTHAKGFDGFISKPVKYDLFAQQIAETLGGKKIWYAG
jgi:two-component system, cell cycle response regulator DivK